MAEFIAGFFDTSRYKRSQGRIARNATLAALLVAVGSAAWIMSDNFIGDSEWKQYGIPLAFFAAGGWASYRIINIPKFADFLISVEAEMNKVSWPTRAELWRASVVVIVVIFFLAALLFAYDLLLKTIMGWLLS